MKIYCLVWRSTDSLYVTIGCQREVEF